MSEIDIIEQQLARQNSWLKVQARTVESILFRKGTQSFIINSKMFRP